LQNPFKIMVGQKPTKTALHFHPILANIEEISIN
jgi:hypothetical protein